MSDNKLNMGQRGLAHSLISRLQSQSELLLKARYSYPASTAIQVSVTIVKKNVMLEKLNEDDGNFLREKYTWQVPTLVSVINKTINESKFYVTLSQDEIVTVLDMVLDYFHGGD